MSKLIFKQWLLLASTLVILRDAEGEVAITPSLRRRINIFANCPSDDTVVCPRLYYPYECGDEKCFYHNPCKAEAAGYDIENDCVFYTPSPTPRPTLAPRPTPSPQAPLIPSRTNTDCPASSKWCAPWRAPLQCGSSGCPYTNRCFARNAGFTPDEECTPLIVPRSPAKRRGFCPKAELPPQSKKNCRVFQPVRCGPYRCWYKNKCTGINAGFHPNECFYKRTTNRS